MVKLGLTTRSGGISSASPRPLQKSVLPAPRSPVRATTSPGTRTAPSARAMARVCSSEEEISVAFTAAESLLLGGLAERLLERLADVVDHVRRGDGRHRVAPHED